MPPEYRKWRQHIVLKAILEELQAKGVFDDDFDKLVADSSLDALVV